MYSFSSYIYTLSTSTIAAGIDVNLLCRCIFRSQDL